MDSQDLSFLSGEVDEPHLGSETAVASPPQPPLNSRETIGFYRAMLDEREKRQALERQIANLTTTGVAPATTPTERDLGITVYANNLRVSRRFAEREYGREVMSAVHDWAAARCDTDPAFNQTMRASDDPYEAAKQAYDQEQAARNTQNLTIIAVPPRSLADAPGNGAAGKPHVPVGDGNAYESLFK